MGTIVDYSSPADGWVQNILNYESLSYLNRKTSLGSGVGRGLQFKAKESLHMPFITKSI
jgi:hypothetical protein